MQVLYPGRIAVAVWSVGVCEGRKIGEPGYNSLSKARTSNKLNPHMAPGRNQTRAILVGGERSWHCAIPAPRKALMFSFDSKVRNQSRTFETHYVGLASHEL